MAFEDVISVNFKLYIILKILIISLFLKVQYSMGLPCGQNKTTCTYLGDIAVIKKDRTCHGVKICEFADLELREMEHKSVDPNSDLRLRMSKELSTDNVNYNTFA